MASYRAVLLRRTQLARQTMAFQLSKPQGYHFLAGQALALLLPQMLSGAPLRDAKHVFSIASSPVDDELMIAMRMRDSAFKNHLLALPEGAELEMDDAFGDFVLREGCTRAVVMIAGGIGITPVLSMLRDALHRDSQRQFVVLYSNRCLEDALFVQELLELEKSALKLKLLLTMTQVRDCAPGWEGMTGYITAQKIRLSCEGLDRPYFYVSGTPAFVAAMDDQLEEAGVDRADMLIESFSGYGLPPSGFLS